MKKNVGGIDQILRIGIGLALVLWAVLGGPVWAWIGIVPLATGALGFCGLYTLLGMSTCPSSCCGGSCASKDKSAEKPAEDDKKES
mgnify:CR=1 FL=1|jgi:hypothetical protein